MPRGLQIQTRPHIRGVLLARGVHGRSPRVCRRRCKNQESATIHKRHLGAEAPVVMPARGLPRLERQGVGCRAHGAHAVEGVSWQPVAAEPLQGQEHAQVWKRLREEDFEAQARPLRNAQGALRLRPAGGAQGG
eukprot:6864751-Pyramimonas_sp.AAC.1